eukprot:TRINITY_DN16387_c0_g1_i1.p1 TRINITY_DN16387_c0_g1~~TRINITY_DN16387_c0_g1_i1.p1  ORF type:complete len:479 (+),score=108.71 TRINITY_DN16387_c0_g1_i1:58-1437(+)
MGIVLSKHTEFASVSNEATEMKAAITLNGHKNEGTPTQATYLMAVIDRSSSMCEGRMEAVKKSLMLLVENTVEGDMTLRKTDLFGIVTYGSTAELILEPTYMNDTGKALAREKIASMSANGLTNIEAGLNLAMDVLLKEAPRDDKNYALWLFTDGVANQGITTPKELAAHVGKINPNGTVAISTFGYGDECDDALLVSVANRGNGEYHKIPADIDTLVLDFATAVGTLLSVVAMNITVVVDLKDGVTFQGDVLGNFHNNEAVLSDDKRKLTMFVKDLIEDQTRSFIINMDLSAVPTTGNNVVGTITIRYFSTAEGIVKTNSEELVVNRIPDIKNTTKDLNYVSANTINETSKTLAIVSKLVNQGDKKGAEQALSDGIQFVSLQRQENKALSAYVQSMNTSKCSEQDLNNILDAVIENDLKQANCRIKRIKPSWNSQRSVCHGTSFTTTSQQAVQQSVKG